MSLSHIHKGKTKDQIMSRIYAQAKKIKKTIAFPESEEPRTLKAIKIILKKGIANVVLVGNTRKTRAALKKNKISESSIKIIDPQTAKSYARQLFELRKEKGMTPEQAKQLLQDPIYYATMLLKNDEIDGIVYGAIHATKETFRPALQIIKTAPGVMTASSFFIMLIDKKVYFYADCAFNIDPNAEQLADIAISTADTAKSYGHKPKIAMLSFSTKGSGEHPMLQKIKDATALVKQKRPDLTIDGELQVDAAVVPQVAKLKAPNSPIKGDANILIFPDLNVGNIAYKLTQRFAHAKPIGPISQGLAKPVNDLSRGCTVEEIVEVAAITAIQAQQKR